MRTLLKTIPMYGSSNALDVFFEDNSLDAELVYEKVDSDTCEEISKKNKIPGWNDEEVDPLWTYFLTNQYQTAQGASGFLILVSRVNPDEPLCLCTSMEQMDEFANDYVSQVTTTIKALSSQADKIATKIQAIQLSLLESGIADKAQTAHTMFRKLNSGTETMVLESYLDEASVEMIKATLVRLEADIESILNPIRRLQGKAPLETVWNINPDDQETHTPYKSFGDLINR